jgi:hypothetical protein
MSIFAKRPCGAGIFYTHSHNNVSNADSGEASIFSARHIKPITRPGGGHKPGCGLMDEND